MLFSISFLFCGLLYGLLIAKTSFMTWSVCKLQVKLESRTAYSPFRYSIARAFQSKKKEANLNFTWTITSTVPTTSLIQENYIHHCVFYFFFLFISLHLHAVASVYFNFSTYVVSIKQHDKTMKRETTLLSYSPVCQHLLVAKWFYKM